MGKLKLFGSAVEGGLNAIKSAGRATHEQQAAMRAARDAEVAEQMANLPARNKKANEALGLYHPVGGGIKLSKPVRGMHATTVRDPKFNPPEIGDITPEQLVKEEAALFPLVGDRAAGGKYLTHVGENELETPVRLTAGPLYMDANYNHIIPDDSAAWESGLGRVTALGRQAERAGEGGRPVYGIYTAGSGTNTDFNVMGANALIQQMPYSKITKKAEKEFDRAMKEGSKEFPPIPNWPGIRSPEAQAMLLDKSNGIVRTKLFGTMGKENFQSMGFPDVPATRKAIIEPELLDVPTNQAGFRMARMDTKGRIIEDPLIPSDYPKAMAGKVAGKLDVPADYKDVFQTHFDARRLLGQPESGDYYSFSRAHPIQYADQQWLDRLMQQRFANERKIKEGSYKKGGAVEDFDAKVDKLIQNHHFDNHVDKRIKEHFAKGGDVKLARTSLRMAGGGMLSKGIGKLGKRLMADPAEVTASIKGGTRKFGDEMGGNTVVKDVGGNWLRDTTGSSLKTLKRKTQGGMKPEDALVQMRERFSDVPEQQQNIRSLEADVALNKWVDSNLNNYVKKQMGTPEDPVRKLAEEDITHFPIAEDPAFWERRGESSRKKLGGSKMAQSDLAQQWENRTDAMLKRDTAQEHQSMMRQAPGMYEKGDEWINKLAPETPIYSSIMNPSDLGFNHIMDVLRADLQAGRIRPEQLSKVSMEQAVRRTYEYDQEMARKMAETQIEVTKGMPVHKEYADKGYKWLELKQPEISTELPPTHQIESYTSKTLGPMHRVVNPETGMRGEGFTTPERALKEFYKGQSEEKLADALKYEGNTMGHCVGSYCDDVAKGRSRIFSLRDSKGEPHVTIETQPRSLSTWDDVTAAVGPEESQKLWKEFDDIGGNSMSDVGQGFDMFIKQKGIQAPEKIVQIKGKGNAKPKEEYLPFVQDFVKSGKWSDVGDFKNTDLYKANPEELGMFLPASKDLQDLPVKRSELLQRAKQSGLFPEGQEYLTRSEWEDILRKQYQSEQQAESARKSQMSKPFDEGDINKFMGGLEPEMARGGGVLKYTTLRNRNTTQSQPNRFADGGKSEMKATPRKKGYGVASDVLKGVHEFASKPFGYENPPVELLSELLGIPAASRVLDKLSYGEPITNAGKANVPLIPDDTFDAATAGLGGLGAASKLAKPLAKGAKYLPKNLPVGMSIKPVGDDIFSKAERDANLSNFLANSKTPERMYHGTRKDIDAFKQSPSGIFFSPNPMVANKFAANNMLDIGTSTVPTEGANVMPVYVRTEKPFDVSKKSDVSKVTSLLEDKRDISRFKKGASESDWKTLEAYSDFIEQAGFDGYFVKEFGENNLSVFKPNQIKSAIGNRGTYDINEADINKARGGSILKHTTLRNRRANQRVR
jgi:hypothetical protein